MSEGWWVGSAWLNNDIAVKAEADRTRGAKREAARVASTDADYQAKLRRIAEAWTTQYRIESSGGDCQFVNDLDNKLTWEMDEREAAVEARVRFIDMILRGEI